MKTEKISLQQAKRLALHSLLLDGKTKLLSGKEGVEQAIEKLHYVQIDTINIIERAHHHTLWTRLPDYDQTFIDELLVKDRRIFEYWAHALCYLPISEYRFCMPRMRNFENPKNQWAKQLMEAYGHLQKDVLKRFRNEGPLQQKDLADLNGKDTGTWMLPKPSRAILDLLFWTGEIMVTERRKFQKVYDLTERVLPAEVDTSFPSDEESGKFLVRSALATLGVAQEKEIRIFMQPEALRDFQFQAVDKNVMSNSIKESIETGEVVRVEIEEDKKNEYFALPEMIEKANHLENIKNQVYLLSPFDNLLTQRDRVKRLFDFEYKLECYTPVAKRNFGYFALPILFGEELVGKLDPEANRKTKTFIIHNLTLEKDIKDMNKLMSLLAEKIKEFALFNKCEKIVIEKTHPTAIKTMLDHHIT